MLGMEIQEGRDSVLSEKGRPMLGMIGMLGIEILEGRDSVLGAKRPSLESPLYNSYTAWYFRYASNILCIRTPL